MNAELAIETSGLRRSFGPTRAVAGVDLAVPTGSVYGLLGPNGAGKTTAVRILATLLRPDGGTATVLGHDVVREAAAVRARVGLTGQFASIDDELTGAEVLTVLGRLWGHTGRHARSRAGELLDAFGLADAAGRLVRTYSGGMRRRLDLAASLIVTPEVLFLDEPTTGLDPRSRNQVWQTVREIALGGSTVLLTTQYLDEADQLADRIAVIDNGAVIAEGTTGELKASVGSGVLRVRLADPEQRPAAARALAHALDATVRTESDPAALSAQLAVRPDDAGERAGSALAELSRSGVAIAEFDLGQPSLDEVFLALTGHPTDQAPPRETVS